MKQGLYKGIYKLLVIYDKTGFHILRQIWKPAMAVILTLPVFSLF